MRSPHLQGSGLSLSTYANEEQAQQRLRTRRQQTEAAIAAAAAKNKSVSFNVPSKGGGAVRQTRQMISDQAKALCSRYLRAKLRACCVGSRTAVAAQKRLGLQRLRTLNPNNPLGPQDNETLPGAGSAFAIAHELRELGLEMERCHPDLYCSVVENIGLRFLPQQNMLHLLFRTLSDELFKENVTWGKVVALYALAGALALDCVKYGRPEYVLALVQDVGTCVEKDNVAEFLLSQGGWGTLLTRFKKKSGFWQNDLFICFFLLVLLSGTILLLHILP